MMPGQSTAVPSIAMTVFGDVHGRLPLLLTITRLWHVHTGQCVAAALQVGDMGAFPDHARLDQATAKMARSDPDELGFRDFVTGAASARRYMSEAGPKVVFIRGNHEDFAYLTAFERPAALDPWQRIIYVPDGHTLDIESDGLSVRIAGFGGLPPAVEERGRGQRERARFRDAQRSAARDPRRFTLAHADAAFAGTGAAIDMLLTHAGPQCPAAPFASPTLARLAERVRPRVHLFGHHHRIVGPTAGPGGSLLAGLEHLEFLDDGRLRPGSCGLLTVTAHDAAFRFFDPETDPWLAGVRKDTYRASWPG